MHYYPFNIGDYARRSRYLSLLQDLAYRRILDEYYLNDGPLVGDANIVAELIGMDDHKDDVALILNKFFKLENDEFINHRADEEIGIYRSKADTARANGRKGGRPRGAANNPDKPSGLDIGTQNKPSSNPIATGLKANQEPRTKNQEPCLNTLGKDLPLSDEKILRQKQRTDLINNAFDFFWTEWPTKKNKQKAYKSFVKLCRSKTTEGIETFVNELSTDITSRVAANDFGFDKMHATTYLNNERWSDAISQDNFQ